MKFKTKQNVLSHCSESTKPAEIYLIPFYPTLEIVTQFIWFSTKESVILNIIPGDSDNLIIWETAILDKMSSQNPFWFFYLQYIFYINIHIFQNSSNLTLFKCF